MRVVEVSNIDVIGNRFNGYDLQKALNADKIPTTMFVMDRLGNDPNVKLLIDISKEGFIQQRIMKYEHEVGLHGMTYPYLWRLQETDEYQQADVVHYHLLHNFMGSYPVLAEMVAQKPSVLTIHDAFLFTGHCIQPMHCKKWISGCINCEYMDVNFKLKWDNAARILAVKRKAMLHTKMHYVVASRFMQRMVKDNLVIEPNADHLHLIPFGINESLFSPDQPRDQIRKRYQIPKDHFALFFRTDPNIYKGFIGIQNMLRQWKPSRPVTLIGIGNKTMLTEFEGKFHIVDLDWSTDEKQLAELYCACDMFLMPSIAEAFGMMALEAMSTERPVLVCDGTALPEITFVPECGVSVPPDDPKAMSDAIEHLMANPGECLARGKRGRELVMQHYRFRQYLDNHIKLYEQLSREGREKP